MDWDLLQEAEQWNKDMRPRVVRDRNEIIEQILALLEDGTGTTRSRIMYNTFTGMRQADGYLRLLERSGLVERMLPQANTFRITNKGRKCLELLRQCEVNWPSISKYPMQS